MSKLVSIITPMYNSNKTIRQMMDSVLAQTYDNWELIIADDLSTDQSVKLVEEYVKKDPRIKLLRTKINTGTAESRNRSISEAKGDYIAFLDSDDTWSSEKLSLQVKAIVDPTVKTTQLKNKIYNIHHHFCCHAASF
ncbi:MAG: glycosyltransferase, partial [gamma proteobacterium symbiont of Bathyaustriella thionipta]|nr:glycosyltransferase [gamma proteobacterium symbiont of Bathyaustriella thionipta]MCU7950863.1 glycosyltransferase [gamma proteobacterium symbiont of Bathyaustriella thionipta]MCU7952932.1 glycosyltransferase [gamma proteobacterium symbiont of Bathyaustriella thionipta]MCU7957999.1 glycosyltransferase [gamma proteobacterium symbiont of Bathyaustriella thionipta]MCU7965855.1 glycosyltransferase [gamma proteobacterium symbiont of Bathyaustriella thionipta]